MCAMYRVGSFRRKTRSKSLVPKIGNGLASMEAGVGNHASEPFCGPIDSIGNSRRGFGSGSSWLPFSGPRIADVVVCWLPRAQEAVVKRVRRDIAATARLANWLYK